MAREEENLTFMQLLWVQSKNMTGQYIPIRQITSAVTVF